MQRLIDANALLSKMVNEPVKAIDGVDFDAEWFTRLADMAAKLPKEGEWIESTYSPGHNFYTCSVCGLVMITTPDYAEKHHYCYGCGSKNKVKWVKGEQE